MRAELLALSGYSRAGCQGIIILPNHLFNDHPHSSLSTFERESLKTKNYKFPVSTVIFRAGSISAPYLIPINCIEEVCWQSREFFLINCVSKCILQRTFYLFKHTRCLRSLHQNVERGRKENPVRLMVVTRKLKIRRRIRPWRLIPITASCHFRKLYLRMPKLWLLLHLLVRTEIDGQVTMMTVHSLLFPPPLPPPLRRRCW